MPDLEIARLGLDDRANNVALARDVGWPDTEGDWNAVHAGALVVGVWAGERLVGQGALGHYGRAGTIAKMIVAPRFQRRGVGRAILASLIAEAECRGIGILGLVATPLGRPLYDRAGFLPVGDVIGLVGIPDAASLVDSAGPIVQFEEMLRIDERYLGCSREGMLRARFREAILSSAVTGSDGTLCGYALATAQGEHTVVGPVIAETLEIAQALVGSILCRARGPVRIDVPGGSGPFLAWLGHLGLREQKNRPEMARGADRLPWQVSERFALAAQAWG
jgi:GNAT superfamily N-acetyltransferase